MKLNLPVDEFIPQIQTRLSEGNNLVITAAPGAGKTTRLPPALLDIVEKKIIVLEPRRMAAIAAAHRIAEERGWTVGEEVGYQVRFANKTSAKTRLIFMTEALLARQMIDDPELSDVDLVILDEFHERSMHVDLALGLLRELQELGRDIKLLVMSATLEAEKISAYLGNSPVVSVPGKLFELEVIYQKNHQVLQTSPAFYENLFSTVKEAQGKTSKDILVFLPGVGEIERAKDNLSSWCEGRNIELVPLHGSLGIEEQRKALQKGSRQRIILSTNIAESSVTLDGVNTVIDSGLAKNMKQDYRTGFSRLELGRISLSSAIQRSGRAARQFPGICYRLWNKMDELSFTKSEVAEIQRVDLTESLLFLAAQGVADFQNFTWFEKPNSIAIEKALQYLRLAKALDGKNKITDSGRKILHFPLPVRLAKLMLVALERGSSELGADLAGILQERDFLRREAISSFLGDKTECDITVRLDLLQQFRKSGKAPREASFFALQTVEQSTRQILSLGKKMVPGKAAQAEPNNLELRTLLLKAFPDRLCRRRGNSDRALMVGGRGVKLQNETLVKSSEFFVALNGVEGSSDAETIVSLACGFSKDFILSHFKDEIQKVRDVTFIEEKGQFFIREYKSLFGLPLEEPSLLPASQQEVSEKLPQVLVEKWDLVLKNNEKLAQWWERVEFFKRHEGLSFESEIPELKLEAFAQACMGESKMQTVFEKDLAFFFENVFPQDFVHTLRKELPDRIEVPSGSKIKIIYPEDKAPYLEVRIQEVFGLQETPKLLFGKIPVTFHLLGPNFRPVQVTANLESFWKNGYPEVRKELRIKYPKHQWPEDPADGTPEAKGRRRSP
ncbi:ATP-dependent helicase HrpB [Bdellovibrio svalbardensis]|uniref:ATP-dependent helicase HrpB n=1 Tax=Bdellovibrio svalbardensis TaxID=2972972 RepID=A0ABT6DFK2_9BACT|nr:ATP-dependent helicase HrpB [Bdellovibrio svalbardensis]MDG0815617.1 ATP-dependent helicase HrpB [Bdellovibrio svalbardensis]